MKKKILSLCVLLSLFVCTQGKLEIFANTTFISYLGLACVFPLLVSMKIMKDRSNNI